MFYVFSVNPRPKLKANTPHERKRKLKPKEGNGKRKGDTSFAYSALFKTMRHPEMGMRIGH
jgi:hypothetical protein